MRWMIPVMKEMGKWDPALEARLREQEADLWERVAKLYRRAGKAEKADGTLKFAAEARADRVDESGG
jgi:hypothetical protein